MTIVTRDVTTHNIKQFAFLFFLFPLEILLRGMLSTSRCVVDLLVGYYPVADGVLSFLSKRDLWSLSLTCRSLRRSLRSFAVGKAEKSALMVVDDFDGFCGVLRSTNSYMELDERLNVDLFHPLGSRRIPVSPVINVYVCGDDRVGSVEALKRYFESVGYRCMREQGAKVSLRC